MDVDEEFASHDSADQDFASSGSEYTPSIHQKENVKVKKDAVKIKKEVVVTPKKNSYVWQYFNPVNHGGKTMNKCKLCETTVGSQITNMSRHLTIVHNIAKTKQPNSASANKNRRSRSFVWKYSTKEDINHARCHFCDKKLYCGDGNTSNLSKHMRRLHSDLIDETTEMLDENEVETSVNNESQDDVGYANETSNPEEDLQEIKFFKSEASDPEFNNSTVSSKQKANHDQSETSSSKKERKGASYVWKYCLKINRFLVECSLCNKQMRFHGTANLITHLQRRHNIMGMDITKVKDMQDPSLDEINDKDDDVPQNISLNPNPKRKRNSLVHPISLVWKYFRRVDQDSVSCNFCKKTLSFQGTSNLQRHLHRMHGVIAQARINNLVTFSDFDEALVWKYCREINETQVKCNMCEKIMDKSDNLDIVKTHLIDTHAFRPLKNSDGSKRMRKDEGSWWDDSEDESQSNDYRGDDYGSQYNENAFVEHAMKTFDDTENDNYTKREDEYLDDLIEEDPDMSNEPVQNDNNSKAYNDEVIEDLPADNPLSSHSSADESYIEQQNMRATNEKHKSGVEYTDKRLQRLHEERVRTETEYFREKAAFFRMRKYLTALEAKKVRIETERLKNLTATNMTTPYTISVTIPQEEDLTAATIN